MGLRVSDYTKRELVKMAREEGIVGRSKMNKDKLFQVLFPSKLKKDIELMIKATAIIARGVGALYDDYNLPIPEIIVI